MTFKEAIQDFKAFKRRNMIDKVRDEGSTVINVTVTSNQQLILIYSKSLSLISQQLTLLIYFTTLKNRLGPDNNNFQQRELS